MHIVASWCLSFQLMSVQTTPSSQWIIGPIQYHLFLYIPIQLAMNNNTSSQLPHMMSCITSKACIVNNYEKFFKTEIGYQMIQLPIYSNITLKHAYACTIRVIICTPYKLYICFSIQVLCMCKHTHTYTSCSSVLLYNRDRNDYKSNGNIELIFIIESQLENSHKKSPEDLNSSFQFSLSSLPFVIIITLIPIGDTHS